MPQNLPETVNREFFLRKVQDCFRQADEATLPASRVYWLALANRWRTLADSDFKDGKESVVADVAYIRF